MVPGDNLYFFHPKKKHVDIHLCSLTFIFIFACIDSTILTYRKLGRLIFQQLPVCFTIHQISYEKSLLKICSLWEQILSF